MFRFEKETTMTELKGTILVDFDRTLALYRGTDHRTIGPPIKLMVERVRRWLNDGYTIRIFTARAASTSPNREEDIRLIGDWSQEHIGRRLEVTAEKGFDAVMIVDDLAAAVVQNTGVIGVTPTNGPRDSIAPGEAVDLLDREEVMFEYVEAAVARMRQTLRDTGIYHFLSPREIEEEVDKLRVAARNKFERLLADADAADQPGVVTGAISRGSN